MKITEKQDNQFPLTKYNLVVGCFYMCNEGFVYLVVNTYDLERKAMGNSISVICLGHPRTERMNGLIIPFNSISEDTSFRRFHGTIEV